MIELKDIKIDVIFDNVSSCNALTSLWGFSSIIQTPKSIILFDTGSNGRVLLKNIKERKLDINRVDKLFLSHAHWDHIGGVDSVLELNPNIEIFLTSHISENLIRDLKTLSKSVTLIEEQSTQISPNIHSTGAMGDSKEQSLIIETDIGLIIIVGCAHSGIEAIATRAKSLFNKEILLLMGGFHLFREKEERIVQIVENIKKIGTKFVSPSHCTGEKAREIFKEKFKEFYIEGGAGTTINF